MDTSLLPDRPWWKFWGGDGDAAKRPHAPGVWLIYFTVASLPLFGLGQWLVPADAGGSPRLAVHLLPRLHLQRHGAAAGDELPEPAALPAASQAQDARGHDGDLAVDGRRADRRPDLRGGAPAGADLGDAGGPRQDAASRATTRPRSTRCSRTAASRGKGRPARARPRRSPRASKRPRARPQGSGKTNDPNAAKQTNGQGKEGGAGRARERPSRGPRRVSPPGRRTASRARTEPRKTRPATRPRAATRPATRAKEQDQAKGQDGRSEDQAEGKERPRGIRRARKRTARSRRRRSRTRATRRARPRSCRRCRLPPLDWLRTPIMIAGVLILIYGIIRYGRDWLEALLAIIAVDPGGLRVRREEGANERGREGSGRAGAAAAALLLVRQPLRRRAGSSTHARRPGALQLRGARGLGLRARAGALATRDAERVREPDRPGARPTSARMPRALVGYFVMIVYGQRGFRSEVLPPLRQFWDALEGRGGAVLAEQSAGCEVNVAGEPRRTPRS